MEPSARCVARQVILHGGHDSMSDATFTEEERVAAEYMLQEMASQKLAVGTAPALHGDAKVRVVTAINPF